MFVPADRVRLRNELVEQARADEHVSATAIVGSAAVDQEDEWSDIDLAFRLTDGADPKTIAESWTTHLYETHHAVHHLDVWAGETLFRVFLLPSSLQVDLSFWPAERFAASSASFRLQFGEANPPATPTEPSMAGLVGMGWLYALHARSSIARGRSWQAVYMLNGIRDRVISLACVRHELPHHQGRGVDDLPSELIDSLSVTLVRSLDPVELHRAFDGLAAMLLSEVAHIDVSLAERLSPPLAELVRTSRRAEPGDASAVGSGA